MGIATTEVLEAHRHRCAISKRRSGVTSLAWSCTQYAISDGGGAAAGGCSSGFAWDGGIPMACGRVGSLEYFL